MSLQKINVGNRFSTNQTDALVALAKDVNPIIDVVNKSKTYKVYTALLAQSETDDPVATVLENTIGDIVWSYVGVGEYYGTLTGAFPDSNKLFIIYGSPSSQGTFIQSGYNNINSVFVATFDNSVAFTDGLLDYTPIEIRVYL